MKDLLKIGFIFTILVAIIPMLAFWKPMHSDISLVQDTDNTPTSTSPAAETHSVTDNTIVNMPIQSETANTNYDGSEEFKVLDFTTGQVLTITMKDYIIGAVLAEMPATFHEEALKAQAVAAHTYAERQKEKQILKPDAELLGAYISNDSTKFQAYFTTEQAKSFYGDAYDEYYTKIENAVTDVISQILYYENEPIVAAFHSTSNGKTESAEVIWGNPVDYLIPVDSTYDTDSPSYLEEKVFTADEIISRVTAKYGDVSFGENPSKWFKIISSSVSGTVTELQVGDTKISGTDFRTLLSLRSATFTIKYNSSDDNFTVTTKGYGHGVGLSQYGANAMANDGYSYIEILQHYYTNVEIR